MWVWPMDIAAQAGDELNKSLIDGLKHGSWKLVLHLGGDASQSACSQWLFQGSCSIFRQRPSVINSYVRLTQSVALRLCP